MKKFLALILVLMVMTPAFAGLQEFRAQHWIYGKVTGAPDGTLVYLYREGDLAHSATGTTTVGNYRINAFALGWRLADGTFRTWAPGDVLKAEVRDEFGTGGSAGPVSLTSTGIGLEKMPDMAYSGGVLDIPYGPQIRPAALFQAFVDASSWSHAAPVVVRVEARKAPAPPDNAGNATTLIGYADVILNADGNTAGRNGFLKPDGTEFGAATPMPDDDYYLAVKQRLTPTLIGMGHLSVITGRKIRLITLANRDASTTRLDLTDNPAVTDDLVNRIYKETPYKPSPVKPDALFTVSGRKAFRAGDMDGNGYVDVVDTSHWFRLFTQFNTGAPDNPADPYIRANLNRDPYVDVVDTSWWYSSFNDLTLIAGDRGPHGYVPAIVP